MVNVFLKDIIHATGGCLLQGNPLFPIITISTDSRNIKAGDAFLAIPGERFDGHAFVDAAIVNGAKTVIAKGERVAYPENISVVIVKDTIRALQDIAAFYRKKFSIPIIAVTGSTGKTTTKDLVHKLLSTKYKTLKSEGNLNSQIGLPMTLFNLENKHEIAVVEMGMNGFNMISRLSEIAEPSMGIITNIGLSHIENLGSKENILKAKLELFERFDSKCSAVLNADDELLWGLKGKFDFNKIYYGTKCGIPYRAGSIESLNGRGISYMLYAEGKSYKINLKIPGRHNVYNSMAAIATARSFGVEFEDIIWGLENIKSHKMRLEISKLEGEVTILDDAYNASPDSVLSALAVLNDLKGKRKIAVLGDMLELGEYAEYAHRQVGKAVFENSVDVLVTFGKYSRHIADEACNSGIGENCIYSFDNLSDVKDMLDSFIESEDAILIKGSRGMRMEEVVAFLKKEWKSKR